MYLALTCIFLAYLLGSISSSSVVGFLIGNIDMRKELDGRMSAAANIYRKLGHLPVCFDRDFGYGVGSFWPLSRKYFNGLR